MSVTTAKGFTAAGVAAGLKSTGNRDVALVVNKGPLDVAAAVAEFEDDAKTSSEIVATVIAVLYGITCWSPALPVAICTATWARPRPMTITTGPMTTGGNRRWMKLTPRHLTSPAAT